MRFKTFISRIALLWLSSSLQADISDITIILAGNYDIKDEALRNRLHIVPFDEISDTCKREIVWKQYFPEILNRYQQSKFQFQPKDFTKIDTINLSTSRALRRGFNY